MQRLAIILAAIFLGGCAAIDSSMFASRLDLTWKEVAGIAEAARARYQMRIVDMHRSEGGDVEVFLADRKDAGGGIVAVYRKSGAHWSEVELPAGEHRVWDRLAKNLPNQPPQRNAGSRPFSDDSSVSETPSSLGPRG